MAAIGADRIDSCAAAFDENCGAVNPADRLRQMIERETLGGVSRPSFQINAASLPQITMIRAIDAAGAQVAPALPRERIA